MQRCATQEYPIGASWSIAKLFSFITVSNVLCEGWRRHLWRCQNLMLINGLVGVFQSSSCTNGEEMVAFHHTLTKWSYLDPW